jgi:hypothetical protein
VKTTQIARWTGLFAGLGLALVTLSLARVPAGTGSVPARLSLVSEPSVRLGVSPVGRELLSTRLLVPGTRSVSGLVQVSNLTGDTLIVRPRLRTVVGPAPEGLRVDMTAAGRKLYSGSMAGLRAKLRLPARAAPRVRFRISAPRSADRQVRGRVVRLVVRWTTRARSR